MKQKRIIPPQNHRKLGFTLLEIMIVVGIIGLLAVIALPQFLKSRTQSQKQTCINNLRQINGAVDLWALENNKSIAADVTWPDIAIYIKAEPCCPAGGTKFDDSYLLTTAAIKATCQRAPGQHSLE